MQKFKVKEGNDKAYLFVNGNTKYLTECDQKDLEVLYNNGDLRVEQENDQVPADLALTSGKKEKTEKS